MLNFIKTYAKVIISVIAIIAISISIVAISCLIVCHRNSQLSSTKYFDFDSIIISDYEYMIKTYDSSTVRYFESQGKLDRSLYETSDGKCVWIKSVFAVGDTVIFITHDTINSKPVIEKIKDIWLEDQVTTPYNKVTLSAAIDSINKVDIIRPKSKVFVVRRPLYPPFPDHNFYIFGDFGHTPFIQVDTKTGEVKINQF